MPSSGAWTFSRRSSPSESSLKPLCHKLMDTLDLHGPSIAEWLRKSRYDWPVIYDSLMLVLQKKLRFEATPDGHLYLVMVGPL